MTSPPDFKLEENEKLLYSDDAWSMKLTHGTIFALSFGILGFPFYTWIIMVGFGGTVVGMSLRELWHNLQIPCSVLLFELALFLPLSFFASKKIPALSSAPNKIVVTNKRIFESTTDKTQLLESRFEDITYIATEITKNAQYLKVKVKTRTFDGDLIETFRSYKVKDAGSIYACLPPDLVQRKGHLGTAAVKERRGLAGVSVLGLFVLLAMVMYGILVQLQENTTALLKEGQIAIEQKDFRGAEKVLSLAYKRNTHIPFQIATNFGFVCYRLAVAKLALGKTDEAIFFFKNAVQHCYKNKQEHNKPYVFRSLARLAHIYELKKDDHSAHYYYENMYNVARLETNEKIRTTALSAYAEFLKNKNESKKARIVSKGLNGLTPDPSFDLDKIWE